MAKTDDTPMPTRRSKPRGWGGTTSGEPEPPSAPKPAKTGETRRESAGRRGELSRQVVLRLRESTEAHLDSIMEPFASLDRTEAIHALIEASTADELREAVRARRRRLADDL